MLYQFDISNNSKFETVHPVTVYNAKTKKPILIDFKADTGANGMTINTKYAQQLGVDLKSGQQDVIGNIFTGSKTTSYLHKLTIKIGNLKPIQAELEFGPVRSNLLGIKIMSQYKVRFTWNKIIYEELTKPTTTTSALAQLQSAGIKNWRNRI